MVYVYFSQSRPSMWGIFVKHVKAAFHPATVVSLFAIDSAVSPTERLHFYGNKP